MQIRFLIVALSLATGGCVISSDVTSTAISPPIAAPATPAAPTTGVAVKRTALVVANIDRSLGIYRDILGFSVNSLTQSGPDSYSYEVFNLPRNKPIRFATLNSGPDQQRSLALIESPGVVHLQSGPRPAALVLNAQGGMDVMMAKVAALGLKIIPERPLNSPTQGLGREVAFLDPDGHLIVLYQFPKSDPPNRM
jgi:catechol 2,3-dioxygenase-like lactoylglutathione lyase family enzyme